MLYTIYKITNTINGKFYIGKHQTNDLNDGYMGSGKILKLAIEKHGLVNFQKEILFVFDNEQDMNEKERELVVISEQSYNLCEGGRGGFGYINKNALNFKGFSSAAERNRKISPFKPGHKLGVGNIGWKYLKEHKLGIFNPDMPNGFRGKRHSMNSKKRISTAVSKLMQGNTNGNKPFTDIKGNSFDSLKSCASFYEVSTETIRLWRRAGKI